MPEELRGTYAGLASPAVVDYLRDLGVTAVELLPVHQFFSEPALLERGLVNYWGYNTIGYFAPDARLQLVRRPRRSRSREFKQMVKTLHAAGIEVILDVVYNHTAEGGADGPTLSFRGLDDRGFYKRVLPERDPGTGVELFDDTYWDVTGCGNTVDSNDPLALRLILDSLRYWVTEMHVDGFRFDLMSALTRTGYDIDMHCRLLDRDRPGPGAAPRQADRGAVGRLDGRLPGRRGCPRRGWSGTTSTATRSATSGATTPPGSARSSTRLAGSSDLYADDGRSPYNSINFVTAHDGFTVRDLVTYEQKHNEANGEGNRDGTDNNRSWNHGVEGETDDPRWSRVRRRQAANIMATLCLSNGVPMITAGDERGRTQRGNNNAYCPGQRDSWIDWRPDDAWLDVYEITKTALRLRREHPALRQRHWFEGRPTIRGGPKDLAWLHPSGREMTGDDWHDPDAARDRDVRVRRPAALPRPAAASSRSTSPFMLWFNSDWLPQRIELPENDWVQSGEVVLSTDFKLPVGTQVKAGDRLSIGRRTVVVFRQL